MTPGPSRPVIKDTATPKRCIMSADPNEIARLARMITEDPNVPSDDLYGDEDEDEDMKQHGRVDHI